jgi:hypothetical protein
VGLTRSSVTFDATNRTITGFEMADRSALGKIGLMLGAAAMMVMMVGAFVVTDHLTGRLQLDNNLTEVALPSAAR